METHTFLMHSVHGLTHLLSIPENISIFFAVKKIIDGQYLLMESNFLFRPRVELLFFDGNTTTAANASCPISSDSDETITIAMQCNASEMTAARKRPKRKLSQKSISTGIRFCFRYIKVHSKHHIFCMFFEFCHIVITTSHTHTNTLPETKLYVCFAFVRRLNVKLTSILFVANDRQQSDSLKKKPQSCSSLTI